MEYHVEQYDLISEAKDGNLLTRELGQRIRARIEEIFQRMPEGGTLVLDLSKIRYSAASCVDELFRITVSLREREFGDKYLLLRLPEGPGNLKDTIDMVLRNRDGVVFAVKGKGGLECLGKLSKALRDTLEAVIQRKEITSKELQEIFHISINACSNRLKVLYKMRLIRREEVILPVGGIQYVYKPLIE